MKGFGAGALAVLIAVCGLAAPAAADPPHIDNGTGGSAPVVSDFDGITLNGSPQLTTASISPFLVVDDSGALGGWNVTLQVPSFGDGTGVGCATGATSTIDTSTLTMDAPVLTPVNGADMTGVSSAGFTDFTAPQKIVDAAAGEGAGTYSVAPPIMRLRVEPDVKATNYCTEAVLTITTGP